MRKKIKINKLLLVFILLIIALIILINSIGKKLSYILSNYALIESRKFTNLLISNAIKNTKLDNDIYVIDNNQVNIDASKVNNYLSNLSINLYNELKDFEDGKYSKKGIIYEIPLSSVLNNPLLSNLGFKIPIKVNFIGDVVTDIKTEIIDYGINNVLFKIKVIIQIKEEVYIPFKSKVEVINKESLVSIKLIEGSVPNYYSSGTDTKFTIPLE